MHCQQTHGVTKQQVITQFGKPKPIFHVFSKTEKTDPQTVSRWDYVNSQQVTDRIRSRSRKFHDSR